MRRYSSAKGNDGSGTLVNNPQERADVIPFSAVVGAGLPTLGTTKVCRLAGNGYVHVPWYLHAHKRHGELALLRAARWAPSSGQVYSEVTSTRDSTGPKKRVSNTRNKKKKNTLLLFPHTGNSRHRIRP